MSLKSHHDTTKKETSPCNNPIKSSEHTSLLRFAEGYLLSLVCDAHNRLPLLYSFADYHRDRVCISTRVKHEGMYFITTVLPELMDGALSHLEHGKCIFPHFKLQRGRRYPRFLKRIFAIVFEQHYTEDQRSIALDFLYSISHAFKKLRGNPDPVLRQKQYDDFVKTDVELGKIDILADDIVDIVENIRSQWSMFAHDITLDGNCKPRPGPGAVVNSIPKSMRYAPHVLYKQLHDVFPYEDWFYSHPWDVNEESRKYLSLPKEEWPFSQYLQVPKTYTKWRGICKETNEAQFLQQGLRRLLNHHIRMKLKDFLPLEDQEIHAEYALQGSIDRITATIDESEASDRILRELVRYVSQDNAELCAALMAVSTRWIKPPSWATQKEMLQTKKFAPMGSAVCFPVMSLIHLFAIRAIVKLRAHGTCTSLKDSQNTVSVYGDDIVLPSAFVEAVYEWLPRLGMKINQGKSFRHSGFRESCGCHAYAGRDITPVYIKYTPNLDSTDAKVFLSLQAVEFDLHNKGLDCTARFIRECVCAKWRMYLPYVHPTSPILGFKRSKALPMCASQYNKRKHKRKWDYVLQCFVYKVPRILSRTVTGIIPNDSQAYLRQLVMSPCNEARYMFRKGVLITPFRMDEFVRTVEDETQDHIITWAYVPESSYLLMSERY